MGGPVLRRRPALVRARQRLAPRARRRLARRHRPRHRLRGGADVLWLAEHGWRATGLDLAPTAVERLNAEAGRRGVAERVRARVHDVTADTLPEGPFDLVTSFYMHGGPEPGAINLPALLRDAAARVAPGGRLVAAVHCVNPPWHRHHAHTYTPDDLIEGLGDAVDGWTIEASEERWREAAGPDGEAGRRSDALICLRRPETA
ncbi:SAM-dependent methyltransferase [Actinomyces denticolens]|uniref:SAM-dependent methyltransferase n=1 Tax=Actinomyces denticolens TaxID=52767 RepID=UPI0027D7AF41|nr:class I SAM-dependent methyltransferase [Actinomyces denticolens]